MDRAVRLDPKGIGARLFRGFTQLNLPPPFRNLKSVIEDLDAILAVSGYNEQAQGVIHVLLGDAYLEMEEVAKAKAHYSTAVELISSTAIGEARARLAAMEQGRPDSRAIQRYRATVLNCARCHTSPVVSEK